MIEKLHFRKTLAGLPSSFIARTFSLTFSFAVFFSFLFAVLTIGMSGCHTLSSGPFSGRYDEKFSLQIVPLFNQKSLTQDSTSPKWQGDWIFRRSRIDLLDRQLISYKPDVLLFTDLVYRNFDPSESEVFLLSENSLRDYEWQLSKVGALKETDESVVAATALSYPNRLHLQQTLSKKYYWNLPGGGYVMKSLFQLSGRQKSLSFVVKVDAAGDVRRSYEQLSEIIDTETKASGLCPGRVLVGGILPEDRVGSSHVRFLSKFGLVDSARGFCAELSECYTEATSNEIRKLQTETGFESRHVRLYVHESAKVFGASRNLEESEAFGIFGGSYGLERYHASDRYGWNVELSLRNCN